MMSITRSCLLALAVVALLVSQTNAVVKFKAGRMLQYNTAEGDELGSRRTSLNMHSVGVSQPVSQLAAGSVKGHAVVLRYDLIEDVADFETLIKEQGALALIVILPSDEADVSADVVSRWGEFEKHLLAKTWDAPIYFARETEDISSFLNSVSSGTNERYQLSTSTGEAVQLKSVEMANVHGWLHGFQKGTQASTLPTIAVVASYDHLGAAPGVSQGADGSASGVSALLELARVFAILYDSQRSQAPVNLVFVLTGGGRMNHAGAKHWLQTADPRELDSIDFALCLDSLGQGEGLKFHVSKVPKEGPAADLHAAFRAQAKAMDFPFEIVHKKINISDPLVSWEHEQFSRKRIVGGTLSHFDGPRPFLQRPTLMDSRAQFSHDALSRNVKFIAEALARFVYGVSDIEAFAGQSSVNTRLLAHTVDTLVGQNRAAPYTGSKAKGAAQVVATLKQSLSQYTSDTAESSFTDDSERAFFGENTFNVEITAHRVMGVAFDAQLALAIVVYCVVIHVGFRGPSEAISGFMSIFASSKKKRA